MLTSDIERVIVDCSLGVALGDFIDEERRCFSVALSLFFMVVLCSLSCVSQIVSVWEET